MLIGAAESERDPWCRNVKGPDKLAGCIFGGQFEPETAGCRTVHAHTHLDDLAGRIYIGSCDGNRTFRRIQRVSRVACGARRLSRRTRGMRWGPRAVYSGRKEQDRGHIQCGAGNKAHGRISLRVSLQSRNCVPSRSRSLYMPPARTCLPIGSKTCTDAGRPRRQNPWRAAFAD